MVTAPEPADARCRARSSEQPYRRHPSGGRLCACGAEMPRPISAMGHGLGLATCRERRSGMPSTERWRGAPSALGDDIEPTTSSRNIEDLTAVCPSSSCTALLGLSAELPHSPQPHYRRRTCRACVTWSTVSCVGSTAQSLGSRWRALSSAGGADETACFYAGGPRSGLAPRHPAVKGTLRPNASKAVLQTRRPARFDPPRRARRGPNAPTEDPMRPTRLNAPNDPMRLSTALTHVTDPMRSTTQCG